MRYKKIFFLFLFSVSIISNSSYASAAPTHTCDGNGKFKKKRHAYQREEEYGNVEYVEKRKMKKYRNWGMIIKSVAVHDATIGNL